MRIFLNRFSITLLIFLICNFEAATAVELAKEHPSTTAQVRLASWWFDRHAEKIAEIEKSNNPKDERKIELLMVGDSITNNFDKKGPGEPVWKKYFTPLNALNLGFGGDRTNHVLWRLEHLLSRQTQIALGITHNYPYRSLNRSALYRQFATHQVTSRLRPHTTPHRDRTPHKPPNRQQL